MLVNTSLEDGERAVRDIDELVPLRAREPRRHVQQRLRDERVMFEARVAAGLCKPQRFSHHLFGACGFAEIPEATRDADENFDPPMAVRRQNSCCTFVQFARGAEISSVVSAERSGCEPCARSHGQIAYAHFERLELLPVPKRL